MDPLVAANLATHLSTPPRTARPRRRHPTDEPARGDLAWSALPHAPKVTIPPPRTHVARQRLATALRQVAAKVDGGRPATPLTRING